VFASVSIGNDHHLQARAGPIRGVTICRIMVAMLVTIDALSYLHQVAARRPAFMARTLAASSLSVG
jgi:hypothetical protein